MFQRTASVKEVQVDSLAIASVLQIGDSSIIDSSAKAIAVQREKELFFGNEGNFKEFPIFSEPIPLPPVYENVTMSQQNSSPFINVGQINIIGISSSSIVHIGNTHHVALESRVKHIRQLLARD
jgi:spore germination protein PE